MIGDKDLWSRGYGADAVKTLVGFGFDAIIIKMAGTAMC